MTRAGADRRPIRADIRKAARDLLGFESFLAGQEEALGAVLAGPPDAGLDEPVRAMIAVAAASHDDRDSGGLLCRGMDLARPG